MSKGEAIQRHFTPPFFKDFFFCKVWITLCESLLLEAIFLWGVWFSYIGLMFSEFLIAIKCQQFRNLILVRAIHQLISHSVATLLD